jgi:uncharacterized protein YecE (DUF72 family)
MKWWAGTSGFSYKEWKGNFYPEKLASTKWLNFYASKLNSVEINNTFYRFPKKSMLEGWANQVPEQFRFVLKAPKRITHFKALKDCEQDTKDFCAAAHALGPRLGAILFQLPPTLPGDPERLEKFLGAVPESVPCAFEFRHASWIEDDVLRLLRARNYTLCLSDTDEVPNPKLISTADFGYIRLRKAEYTQADISRWHEEIEIMKWKQVFVFLKHEDGAIGPKLAQQFL